MSNYPILYSFRRCPYAMRARLALAKAGIKLELREIVLKDKPDEMLQVSPKGTVPVMVLETGNVLEESLDIMHWALGVNDPDNWLREGDAEIAMLINRNDNEFKGWLDRYKYADRYPEHSQQYYREQCELHLAELESRLKLHKGSLLAGGLSLADYAILPFIRQFAHVDLNWFNQTDYPALQQWLESFKSSELFLAVMPKFKPWKDTKEQVLYCI